MIIATCDQTGDIHHAGEVRNPETTLDRPRLTVDQLAWIVHRNPAVKYVNTQVAELLILPHTHTVIFVIYLHICGLPVKLQPETPF